MARILAVTGGYVVPVSSDPIPNGTVVITDLHSRNGTHVVAPGKPPVKLRSGEPTPVLTGTVVDLGGGWTIQVVGG